MQVSARRGSIGDHRIRGNPSLRKFRPDQAGPPQGELPWPMETPPCRTSGGGVFHLFTGGWPRLSVGAPNCRLQECR